MAPAIARSLTLLCVALAACSHARTYYVALGGLDSDSGTVTRPFATIAGFHTVAAAGDTCLVRGGTYTPAGTIVLTKDGIEGHPICLFAYPGETPVFDGRNATDNGLIKLSSANWWHIRGLVLTGVVTDWVSGLATIGTCTHLVLEQLVAHHCAFTGLTLGANVSDILVLNCDAHHNVDTDYEDADGFQVTSGASGTIAARVVFRGCRAWNNADDGWDLYFATRGSVLIEQCWSFRNGYDDAWNEQGNGGGFKIGGPLSDARVSSSGGHTVLRCLAWKNKYCGFNENTNSDATPDTLYHCTGFDNRGWRDYDFDCGLVHVLRNNLTCRTAGAATGASSATHNSWSLGLTLADSDFLSVDDAGTDGPRGADGALPVLDFLKPSAGSRVINRGLDIGLPYSGSAPDLGAYEYMATGTTMRGSQVAARSAGAVGPRPFVTSGRVAVPTGAVLYGLGGESVSTRRLTSGVYVRAP